jgi:transposase InsO family protein
MISVSDRRYACQLIEETCLSGARQERACAELEIDARTYRRWVREGDVKSDGRPAAKRAEPRNKLSDEERTQLRETCHRPEFASLPPSQIVPHLADRGEYIASESTFYRVLRAAGEQHHRGRSRAPERRKPPTSHGATRAGEVWSWDITYLAGLVRGLFYYLYLILDIYSRKIVGWEVFERECGEHAVTVVERAVLAERCVNRPLVLHADNGSPMKGATLRATLERLGIEPSHSRPRVSNDNPFSEAAFRTCKYRPDFPSKGFESLGAARQWVHGFVAWYNGEHRHSGIRFVTPDERHRGLDRAVLAKREVVYAVAKTRHPERWSGKTRNWEPVGTVWLNPENPSPTEEVVEA